MVIILKQLYCMEISWDLDMTLAMKVFGDVTQRTHGQKKKKKKMIANRLPSDWWPLYICVVVN